MLTSLLQRAWKRARGISSPIIFPSSGFDIVSDSYWLEEERFPDFQAGRYYPVNIGGILASRYQVVGKLGFGTTSTVWLARDLQGYSRHVALKVFTSRTTNRNEIETYQYLQTCPASHPGRKHIRTALDVFTLSRSNDTHQCIVHTPLWLSWKDMVDCFKTQRFTEDLLKSSLLYLFKALDYLHAECHIVHTDIKADNILLGLEDSKVLDAFVKDELDTPAPRKFINGSVVYASQGMHRPRYWGEPILSDLGSAVRGDVEQTRNAQPDLFRAPEVMLGVPWSYPIDIWNVGCMIWDIFENKQLFRGRDRPDHNPNGNGYTTRAHLAEVVAMLGPPPADLLLRGSRSERFFTEDGEWCADFPIPEGLSLETSEENLAGENKVMFMKFVRSMLQWRPEDRKTAKELLDDPWLNTRFSK